MSAYRFYMPALNHMGAGCLDEAISDIRILGLKQALIVTDKVLTEAGVVSSVTGKLGVAGIACTVYDKTQPNPTVRNVEDGLKKLTTAGCDCVISLGGGSPHDCAKGIALVASNGGSIKDYEGVDKSTKPQLTLICINTTAGTASEITRFCIITDELRHIKMAIVDKNTTPTMSVNDPSLMQVMLKSLTAATGMDALAYAVEAYVSTAATPVTDACALQAIELVSSWLRTAVYDGNNIEARNQMAYGQLLAGMAFNSASLGYVHAMAHQLGGFYDLPHGVCNAILLPHVESFNAKCCPEKLARVAAAMGVDISGISKREGADRALEEIQTLAWDIGIPEGLETMGVKKEDFGNLADNALKDACSLTNPIQATREELVDIFESAF
ncbi:iron-containing alcohol dehydrogenase [Sansalvadorimonas sp. 2012CJ34-2]|uniref:Iron-containing alcohol dehydrogenase n=1 Tax=Parendozoicomonas callyspongiae TaxID=2942213 RepID=A0ABT0PDT2_9GAMM|nr:iron-containing alcohol dehydrogenase [Sansalvadorimonas sp. 2012CJ34-2]MCL6269520.1 iron-containing alcohol dehydrogenase [Sansalvadorimonas sp. 2012CJ34-2]